jgi:hypothetical protein
MFFLQKLIASVGLYFNAAFPPRLDMADRTLLLQHPSGTLLAGTSI